MIKSDMLTLDQRGSFSDSDSDSDMVESNEQNSSLYINYSSISNDSKMIIGLKALFNLDIKSSLLNL